MGACASKFTVLKNAADAPPPVPKEELAAREVNLVEEMAVKKDDGALVAAADDQAKHQSLGRLFKQNEVEKGSVESNGKALEDVKKEDAAEAKHQENENVKSLEAVADVPAKDETDKAPAADGLKCKSSEEEKVDDVKPVSKILETEEKKIEEKPAETVELETAEKVEMLKTENPQKNKPAEIAPEKTEELKPASDAEKKKEEEKPTEDTNLETSEKKLETPETEKTEEQKPVSDAEREKEEKPAENTKIETLEKKPEASETEKTEEQEPASDAEKKKVEEKPAESTKTEILDKVEDKHVLEPLKTENPSDNNPDEKSVKKPETPETSSKEQKPSLDAEKPTAGEEKTEK